MEDITAVYNREQEGQAFVCSEGNDLLN